MRYILEVCRSMYAYADKQRHLPPYAANSFANLSINRLRVTDAKPVIVFNESTALRFLKTADEWSFAIHATLALTGMRPGELGHLLIEELDLAAGWLHVCNKADLGWEVKTRNQRRIPLITESIMLLRRLIGVRERGLVFVRPQFGSRPTHQLGLNRKKMVALQEEPIAQLDQQKRQDRIARQRISMSAWRDVGLVDSDQIRRSFLRVACRADREEATCPKSWRHSFATLLQDANVDPLIRQMLGHQPQGSDGALGMTTVYTHTRPETQAREQDRALRTWSDVLELIAIRTKGGAAC
jgi:integrase